MNHTSPRSSRSRASRMVAALLALAGASGAAARPAGDEFARLLSEAPAGASAEDLAPHAKTLARLDDAAARYLELRRAEFLPPTVGSTRAWTDSQRRLLELVAPLLPSGEVVRAVRACANELDDEGRLAALRLMRWHTSQAELGLLVNLAAGTSSQGTPGPLPEIGPHCDAFLAALAELARRDLRAVTRLGDLEPGPTPLLAAVVRAVGRSDREDAASWLAQQLAYPEMASLALQEIGRVGHRVPGHRASVLAQGVRPFLDAGDESTRRQAMRALVELRDPEAVPRFIKALEAESPGERRDALRGLESLTGLGYPENATVWRRWHEAELRWLADDAPAQVAGLASDDAREVVAAIHALSGHRLYRHELALQLGALLRSPHGPVEVRRQVCLALPRLGSDVAAPDLMAALDDADEGVRDLAWRALRSLTGRSLPARRADWEEALSRG